MSESSAPSARRQKVDLSQDQNITVVVGAGQKKFTVHKCVLVQSSDFFKACCDGAGDWKETTSRTVTLPGTGAEDFQVYAQWLYSGKLVPSEEYDLDSLRNIEKASKSSKFEEYWTTLQALAKFADQMGDVAFGNTVMDWMIKLSEDLRELPTGHIRKIHSDFPQTSLVRRMLVDNFVASASPDLVSRCTKNLPHEFLVELVAAYDAIMRGGKVKKEPKWENRCDYHVHNDKVPKCT